ncbi:MAG: zinc ribbon domain-containing protein [Oscillospiraceae bacterium]|jgi:hypothetical protein|nr:zinc ribbon domain-containing protein [Oscillospiraceae bacterium]
MSVKLCVYCGFEIDDTLNFCPNCGKAIRSKEVKKAEEDRKESMFDLENVDEFNNTRFWKMYQSISPEEAGRDLYPPELFNFSFNFSIILKIIGVIGFIICLVIAVPMSGLDHGLDLRSASRPLLAGVIIMAACFLISFAVKSIGKLFKKAKDKK